MNTQNISKKQFNFITNKIETNTTTNTTTHNKNANTFNDKSHPKTAGSATAATTTTHPPHISNRTHINIHCRTSLCNIIKNREP
jgi:hypothetical protein